MSIDKRKKYYIVLDTETCPLDRTVDGVKFRNNLVYDIGFAVVDKKGHIYEQYSFVIADVFYDYADLMKSAYYADKIPQYKKDIKAGKHKLAHLLTVKFLIENLQQKYNTKVIVAHNASFDVRSLNNTIRFLTKSKYRYFFSYGTEIWCSLKMSRQIFKNRKGYQNWCKDNGYLTKRGQARYTAEILYRYLSGDQQFQEYHTGLQDVLIEKTIFSYCITRHTHLDKVLYV